MQIYVFIVGHSPTFLVLCSPIFRPHHRRGSLCSTLCCPYLLEISAHLISSKYSLLLPPIPRNPENAGKYLSHQTPTLNQSFAPYEKERFPPLPPPSLNYLRTVVSLFGPPLTSLWLTSFASCPSLTIFLTWRLFFLFF